MKSYIGEKPSQISSERGRSGRIDGSASEARILLPLAIFDQLLCSHVQRRHHFSSCTRTYRCLFGSRISHVAQLFSTVNQ